MILRCAYIYVILQSRVNRERWEYWNHKRGKQTFTLLVQSEKNSMNIFGGVKQHLWITLPVGQFIYIMSSFMSIWFVPGSSRPLHSRFKWLVLNNKIIGFFGYNFCVLFHLPKNNKYTLGSFNEGFFAARPYNEPIVN